MQVSGAGIAGPGEVSAAASFAARMASICNAAKPAKSAPVGLPSEPRKPESTSLPIAATFRKPTGCVTEHRVRGLGIGMHQKTLYQIFRVGPKTRPGVVECHIEAGLRYTVQDAEELTFAIRQEYSQFVARLQIERVDGKRLSRRLGRFFGSAKQTEHRGLQIPRLQVIGVRSERLVEVFETGHKVALEAVDRSQRVVRGRLPGVVPCRFVESGTCVGESRLVLQRNTQVIPGLAFVRV